MTAAVILQADGELTLAEVSVAAPREHEVLVRVAAAGVCHSDLHVVERRAAGMKQPLVLGHEGSGYVEAIGPGVSKVRPGDQVIFTVVPQCGRCQTCQAGHPTLCQRRSATGTGTLPDGTTRTTWDGGEVGQMAGLGVWSERTVVSEMSLVRVEDPIDPVAAALIGCGAVTGFGAVWNIAEVQPGDAVAVIGCGGLGLNAIQAARLAGAATVVAVDVEPSKLALAEGLGATHIVDSSADDPATAVADATDGLGCSATLDFVVSQATVTQALGLTRPGGTVVLTGLGAERLEFTLTDIVRAGRQIRGNYMGMGSFAHDFERIVTLYRDGEINLDDLVHARLKLPEFRRAFDTIESGKGARSVFVMSPSA